jgi:hypothetical protein
MFAARIRTPYCIFYNIKPKFVCVQQESIFFFGYSLPEMTMECFTGNKCTKHNKEKRLWVDAGQNRVLEGIACAMQCHFD